MAVWETKALHSLSPVQQSIVRWLPQHMLNSLILGTAKETKQIQDANQHPRIIKSTKYTAKPTKQHLINSLVRDLQKAHRLACN